VWACAPGGFGGSVTEGDSEADLVSPVTSADRSWSRLPYVLAILRSCPLACFSGQVPSDRSEPDGAPPTPSPLSFNPFHVAPRRFTWPSPPCAMTQRTVSPRAVLPRLGPSGSEQCSTVLQHGTPHRLRGTGAREIGPPQGRRRGKHSGAQWLGGRAVACTLSVFPRSSSGSRRKGQRPSRRGC